jgi:hypothetical protein
MIEFVNAVWRNRIARGAALAGAVDMVLPVYGDHSFAAEFDGTKAIRKTGVISLVEWAILTPTSRSM